MTQYVLGVDGGSSKTHAVVLDTSGKVLGLGQAGTANHQVTGLLLAMREIEQAVTLARRESQLLDKRIGLGMFCLAGADLPEDFDMLSEAIAPLQLAERILIRNDTMAILRSGLSRTWGVTVICGTGFNAAGRGRDGREIQLPGLGPISGDWGGGGALSQEMIRLVMRAWDGRQQSTLLTGIVLAALDAPTEEELLHRLYHDEISQDRLLGLVPLLFEAAEAGDAASRELIKRMGTEVGITALALIRRLDLTGTDVEVVLGGSVFKGKGDLLVNTVTEVIHLEEPETQIVRPSVEPVLGAALMALEALGVNIDGDIYGTLVASAPGDLKVRG